jgi:UDP-3-O-[3-hydroxymyristoyl] glucosamine N-acyltransferase
MANLGLHTEGAFHNLLIVMHNQGKEGFVSPRASISTEAFVAPSARIYGSSVIERHAIIEHGVIIGHPSPSEQRQLLAAHNKGLDFDAAHDTVTQASTRICASVVVRSGTVIYSGSTVHPGADIAHNCLIRENSVIGSTTHLLSCTQVMSHVIIGMHCRIAGTLCNRTKVGNFSSMLGHAMHSYRHGLPGKIEVSPILGNGVIIGRESSLIGEIVVHDFALVGAGAVLTQDAAPRTLWLGNPARLIRERTDEEISEIRILMQQYEPNKTAP